MSTIYFNLENAVLWDGSESVGYARKDNSIDRDNIAMFKFDETSEEWNELITIYVDEEGDYYNYDVELSSFSYFTISEKVVAEAESEEKSIVDTIEKKIPEVVKENLKWLWITFGGVVLIVIGYFFGKNLYEKYQTRFNEKIKVVKKKK